MAEIPGPIPNNSQSYQAPQEVSSYIPAGSAAIPSLPPDIYSLLGVAPNVKTKSIPKPKSAYEMILSGEDPFGTLIPDIAPFQTNLKTIAPLNDPAGLFHSQDGFGKYGYSSILGEGDNEARYAENFRQDNPSLFSQPGFHPINGIKRGLYWGGGFLEKTVEGAITQLGQGFGNVYGMSLQTSIDLGQAASGGGLASFDGWLANSADNILSNTFKGWNESLKERYHYFQEKSDRDRKGFVESLGDGDFWMNDISDGLSFLVSSMFEAGLISKLGLGTKAATAFAPLAEGVSTTALNVERTASTLNRANKFKNALSAVGFEGHAAVKNAVDLTTQTLALTSVEAAIEANETKEQVLASFDGRINPETGFLYSQDEKERLAAAAAGQVFQQNMAMLAGPKFLELLAYNKIGNYAKGLFNKSFGQATVEGGKASGAIRSRLGTLSSGTSYNKASVLNNIWKVGSLASIGFLSEGLFEENIQLAMSRTAQETFGGGDEFYRPGTTDSAIDKMESEDDLLFGAAGRKYLEQTSQFFRGVKDSRFIDDELSKSVGIGGLFGVFGGATTGLTENRQRTKIDNYWNNRLNGATTNLFESQTFWKTATEERPDPENPGKTKPTTVTVVDSVTGQPILDEKKLTSYLNEVGNIQGIMDIIANTEDTKDINNNSYQNKELNKLARSVLFSKLAMEYIRAGKKDLLLENLAATSQFQDQDIQALGYQPGMMSENDKKNMLSKMTNMVNKLSKADDWIENNIVDNVSEQRTGRFGLSYSKTQQEKRSQEFEAKKAYLRGLAMQNSLLDTYEEDLAYLERGLSEPLPEVFSSTLDENGVPIIDYSVSLEPMLKGWNSKIPALQNQIAILQKEFAYQWDNILSRERLAPKGEGFSTWSKSNNGKILVYSQTKAQEALERMNTLQEELDKLLSDRNTFLSGENAFDLVDEDGNIVDNTTATNQNLYVVPRVQQNQSALNLEQIESSKIRRINEVKREEISIQRKWIEEEWKLTAALKEPKTVAGRKDTLLSRRRLLSRNAYNTYFQREVATQDNSLGQRKMSLSDKNKEVTVKQYKANEAKLFKYTRIDGKVQSILAEVNGQKLLAELNALLNRDLQSGEFTTELQKVISAYNGKSMILSPEDKNLVDDQITDTEDEYNFVNSIFEYMPLDDRFNDKYYQLNDTGSYIVKPEYDDIQVLAETGRELSDRVSDLDKIRKYLKSIPESISGDWNNPNIVRRRIANVYFETGDNLITSYNQISNNGESEMSGDSLSTRQDLDIIDQELRELKKLKEIFEERDKTDNILTLPEFLDFIPIIDQRVVQLTLVRGKVKERLDSRLRENQDFLVDTINNLVEQLGVSSDGETVNPVVRQKVESIVSSDMFVKLMNSLISLRELNNKEVKDTDDKKAINDAYWTINGQVSAIQEVIKRNGKKVVSDEISKQKQEAITRLETTSLMKSLKDKIYYSQIINNIDDSVLGVLQTIFYQTEFSQVGTGDVDPTFLDDQAYSPVYKFREDYNLRKFLRAIDRDVSRTPENTNISKAELLEFLKIALEIQNLESLQGNLDSSLNLTDQVEREKEVVQTKKNSIDQDTGDTRYENLIIPSIQQLLFLRKISSFLRTEKVKGDNPGFRNWIYIQAPAGAGKTSSLGSWFSSISGIQRDRILATAFTEEASRAIKKSLIVGEEGPKDAKEMASTIRELTTNKQFDNEVLIIDEFPAIEVQTQKELFDAVTEYTKAKKLAGKGEFKVITMGDTNQLTFESNGLVIPRPSILANPNFFNIKGSKENDNHPSKMTIIPSLTVNFRSNIFAITSFVDQFKGSSVNVVNADIKVMSTNPTLDTKDIKGVVSIAKADFQTKLISYLKLNQDSIRTKVIIVNESKLDQYKKLLIDNGITVITDPNDEITKGVYVSAVRNVQGFSFDEVFIDLESNDKSLFSGSSSPDFIFNKAMYVAASRARNLVVTTNFPNFENIEDLSINDLENKSLEELQTKDEDFLLQRDLEIGGAKSVMGNEYVKTVTTAAPIRAEDRVETPLDQDEELSEDEIEIADEEDAAFKLAEENNLPKVEEDITEQITNDTEGLGTNETSPNEVIVTDGLENYQESSDIIEKSEEGKTLKEQAKKLLEAVKDKGVSAFNTVKDTVVELLFPTGQTAKYKISDGIFRVIPGAVFENQALKEGDNIIVIPFRKSESSKSPRKFGYAIITPARGQDSKEIPNSYRTVSVLSDTEINNFVQKPETSDLYNAILQNEEREVGFVSISYADISDSNGLTTSKSKIINELYGGKVTYSQAIKYIYGNIYKDMKESELEGIIKNFIKDFYKSYLNGLSPENRIVKEKVIRDFYKSPKNAQIIIPTNKDVLGENPRLNIPLELRDYILPGRPYLMIRPIFQGAPLQFIPISRKFLNTESHNEILEPIRKFINVAKVVKELLKSKGINSNLSSLGNTLSHISSQYAENKNENNYTTNIWRVDNKGVRTKKEFTFSNVEAERIYNMYSLYSEPNTQMIKAENDQEIQNLIKIRVARNFSFADGETIYGTIESFDPKTRTFVVKDRRAENPEEELKTKSGIIRHSSKSSVGRAQRSLDNIMLSNGNIASRFSTATGRVGFTTNRFRKDSSASKGYKFMALLGSKQSPVPKTYNNDGTVKEYYEDIIDILENLFNFTTKGELPGIEAEYINQDKVKEVVQIKFRVPVSLNSRDENGQLEYDYSYSEQNTSRSKTSLNSAFFESNFESMLPTRIFVQFGETQEENEKGTTTQPTQVVEEENIVVTPDLGTLTTEQIQTLSFLEIKRRLTSKQRTAIDEYAKKEEFNGIDHFFEVIESNHPNEQEIFRDYIIECLL